MLRVGVFKIACAKNREAPVRFGSVTVWGWKGSSGSGFRSGGSSAKGVFCVSVQFNREGRFRFRLRFLEDGSGGSGSTFGFGKNGSDRSGFWFWFGSWATPKKRSCAFFVPYWMDTLWPWPCLICFMNYVGSGLPQGPFFGEQFIST